MANVHFLRKLAQDELWDTLFFATGELPTKEKFPQHTILKVHCYEVQIFNDRRITVNGDKCKSIREAKYAICERL